MVNGKWELNSNFHSLIGLTYLIAFISFYFQYDGLVGKNGVLPVDSNAGEHEYLLVQLSNYFGISIDGSSELLFWIGCVASTLVICGIHHVVLYCLCWVSYLSLREIGQTFFSFQWDILLLEVGFVCLFSSSWGSSWKTKKHVSMNWCFRYLAFKLMMQSGVVKLQSMCPKWNDLSALEYHFASQCIPTPVAWFVHQLPPVFLAFGVVATFAIEIPLSVMLISPLPIMRKIGALSQWFLQLMIIVTGNYTFFNLLTCVLMLKAWESDVFDEDNANLVAKLLYWTGRGNSLSQQRHNINNIDNSSSWLFNFRGPFVYYVYWKEWLESKVWFRMLDFLITSLAVCFSFWAFIDISPSRSNANHYEWWRRENIVLRSNWADIAIYLRPVILVSMVLVIWHIVAYCALEMRPSLTESTFRSKQSTVRDVDGNVFQAADNTKVVKPWVRFIGRILRFLMSGFRGVAAVTLVFLSVITFSSIAPVSNLFPHDLLFIMPFVQRYSITSSYGLFRHMTGAGSFTRQEMSQIRRQTNSSYIPALVARPEVVLEGLDSTSNKWIEIPFRSKPTSLFQAPTFVAPYQPRLDWQMWFAALGSYNSNPWLIHLIYKLVNVKKSGNNNANANAYSKATVSLLDEVNYPFKQTPPLAVRAVLYDYDFTRISTPWANKDVLPHAVFVGSAKKSESGSNINNGKSDPWWSRRNGREYLFAINQNHPGVEEYLRSSSVHLQFQDETPVQAYQYCLKGKSSTGKKKNKSKRANNKQKQGSATTANGDTLEGFHLSDLLYVELPYWEEAKEVIRERTCSLLLLKDPSRSLRIGTVIEIPLLVQCCLSVVVIKIVLSLWPL